MCFHRQLIYETHFLIIIFGAFQIPSGNQPEESRRIFWGDADALKSAKQFRRRKAWLNL